MSNLKKAIKESAKQAVIVAEKTLGSNKGKQKKEMAVNYVINHLPLPAFLKKIATLFLSSFIDDAIELAVEYMEVL